MSKKRRKRVNELYKWEKYLDSDLKRALLIEVIRLKEIDWSPSDEEFKKHFIKFIFLKIKEDIYLEYNKESFRETVHLMFEYLANDELQSENIESYSNNESFINPLNGNHYTKEWIRDVFGINPDDENFVPWGNID